MKSRLARSGPPVTTISLALLLIGIGPLARSQDPGLRPFQIEPQPISRALRTFAQQAQLQIIFSEQDLGGLDSTGVAGDLAPRMALERLLSGTDLNFEFTTSNVVVVRKARALTDAPRTASPSGSGALAQEREAAIGEVTVTGSRIVRRDFDAKSPIVTVDARTLEESGTLGVESVLNRFPQFVPTETQFETNDIFPTAVNTPGIASLNLRGLSTNRTLVLIEGRRAQPANSTLIIDLNTIPTSAISKVEIITGGASATYGADAMGGVTNFKLREDFQGATVDARTGITQAGDGQESRLSALLGSNLLEGRGNVMVGVEWTKRSAAKLFGRRFFENALTDPGAPTTAVRLDYSSYEPNSSAGGLPSQAAANALFPERAPGTNVTRNTAFFVNRNDNTLFKDVNALGYTGEFGQQYKLQPNGVLGENNLDELVSSPMTRYSFIGRGHFTISDRLSVYTQATFANTKVNSIAQPVGAVGTFAASIPRDSAHPVPTELVTLLDSRGPDVLSTTEFDPSTGQPIVLTGVNADWRLGRPLNYLPPRQLRNASDVYQLLVGARGDVPFTDWSWDAYFTHGESETENAYLGFASQERYRAVVQSPNYGRGFTQTGAGQTSVTCTSGLPIFEQFAVTQDCVDAITTNLADRTRLSQDVLEANAEGAVVDLPAGQMRAALGATYRANEFDFRPDALRETNSIIDVAIGTFANAQVKGRTEVTEAYGELLLPVLKDEPLVESLELELGARYSNYDTTGGVPTYKALFGWTPVHGLRFRGGYQLANRAPNINELFLSASSVPVTLRGPDPCRADTLDANGNRADNPKRVQVQALCSAIIGSGTSSFDDSPNTFIGDGRTDGGEIETRSGNSDLDSEAGTTWTFGFVFTSPFEHALTRAFTLAIDWYRANVTGAIAQVGAQTTYDLCFNRDGLSNPDYSIDDANGMCRRIVRDDVTGNRERVSSVYANLGTLETSGIDVLASWTVRPEELGFVRLPGSVSLDIAFNKLIEFESQSFPTSEVRENRGTLARFGLFSYRALTTLRYTASQWDVALEWSRLPSVRNANYVTDPFIAFAGAESYNLYDFSASWSISPTFRVLAGIDNLFDRDPNRVGAGPNNNGGGNTIPAFYDVLGRRYYVALRMRF